MRKPVSLIAFWIVNSLLVYLATRLMPANYVLGNVRHSVLSGAIVAGFVWTALVWIFKKALKNFKARMAQNQGRILFYIAVNFVVVWVVARFAPYTGFGLTSFVWAFVLGLAGSIVHFGIWKLAKRIK